MKDPGHFTWGGNKVSSLFQSFDQFIGIFVGSATE